MKHIIVANYNNKQSNSVKSYSLDRLCTNLQCQIANSESLGNLDDLLVITNFPFRYLDENSIQLDLNKDCLTGSKLFALRELFNRNLIQSSTWIHDLDVWQVMDFDEPKFKDIGLCEYSRPKFNGGSLFIKPEAKDIVLDICDHLEKNSQNREEPTLDLFLRNTYKDRTTKLNSTYNIGCSGFVERVKRAEKPIKVVHFHPTNRLAWDSFCRDRNNTKVIPVTHRLKKLFVEFYQKEIDSFRFDDLGHPWDVRTYWQKPFTEIV